MLELFVGKLLFRISLFLDVNLTGK